MTLSSRDLEQYIILASHFALIYICIRGSIMCVRRQYIYKICTVYAIIGALYYIYILVIGGRGHDISVHRSLSQVLLLVAGLYLDVFGKNKNFND